ncbi:universal stress protein [Nonomuraea antimicrobica]
MIGSAPGGGRGRISVGSTADQLLHSSSVPVLLAPRGYGEAPPAAFDRLTVAYRRGPGCDLAVKDAARAAVALDVPLRRVTLVVSAGRRARIAEEMLVRLREQAAADLRAAARGQRRRLAVEVEVLEGGNVARALGTTSWLPGEMIICASSDTGPLRRVFLGDTSIKIVRASTRPVMILTRQP